jgi:hypothetical protein
VVNTQVTGNFPAGLGACHYPPGGSNAHHEGMTSTRRPLATIAATVLFGFALAEVITAIVASTLSG